MRTTPTASIEVLLNLPPLHIFIEGAVRATRHLLLKPRPPPIIGHGVDRLRMQQELEADPITGGK